MMKNKMFTRVLGMTCALIMAVTAIVPVCAKESGDQANSFRYENGQAAVCLLYTSIGTGRDPM